MHLSIFRQFRLFAVVFCAASVPAASTAQATPPSRAVQATLAQATILRDAYIAHIHAAGFNCSLSAPTIVVEDVPSFGNYQSGKNVLRTSEWTLLSPQEHAFFMQIAGPGATEDSARALFETAAHKWIFIHELGHWWQACQKADKGSPYHTELGANRISLAYWREVDPTVVQVMMPIFQGVVDHMPSPMPPAQEVQPYFDANYEKLGPSPAYPWFMSRMNVAAYDEKPAPTFAAVLALK